MNTAMLGRLVIKDWYFNRVPMALLTIGGLVALAVFGVATGPVRIGAAVLFTGAASVLIFMPTWAVIGERKEQTLAFIMSLPVSIRTYTAAKIIGTMISGLSLWLVLLLAYIVVAANYAPVSAGSIPATLAVFGMVFAIFCLNLGIALVLESEKPAIFATVFCNIFFWFFYSFFYNAQLVAPDLISPTIVWRPDILWTLAGELAASALFLGLTFYLQSRKTDFI